MTLNGLFSWLPKLKREIWILSAGQLLLYIGQGFTLVYASIYFVNQLGFSPTQVGLALGSGGIAGTLGRFWAGKAIESPRLGRRGTLLIAAAIAALGSFVLALAHSFALLVAGNMLLGLGISLYWPATLAAITDLTSADHRAEALALTRLADNLGLGIGALIAGQYLAMNGSYPVLFICKGLAYLVFCGVIFGAIAETRPVQSSSGGGLQSWRQALGDRRFRTYLLANLFFTLYVAQLSTTLPLFLNNFVPGASGGASGSGIGGMGFSEQWISYFFGWHALLKILLQLPLTRWLRPVAHASILLASLTLWIVSLGLFWLLGTVSANSLGVALVAFAMVAIAEVLYGPAASALVGEMAPVELRGIYFALDSQCWAIGFLIGPAVGGWALDHPAGWSANLWLVLAALGAIAAGLLTRLKTQLSHGLADTAIEPSSSPSA